VLAAVREHQVTGRALKPLGGRFLAILVEGFAVANYSLGVGFARDRIGRSAYFGKFIWDRC